MYAVEKKFEIEMKLKKEISNIQELKAAAKRSSSLANDVCCVLGACEQRLQQLESAVLPLYGDTARLQQIHHNMERTVKALDHVINYYMVSRELADLIQAGPHTASTESLNIYLEALDKLSEAQTYFNKNNPQSVELENINQLYNSGVQKLENAFEELLARNTRPLSPTTIMDMIALEEDSSVESVSVSNSGSTNSSSLESLRAAAGWLSAAGRCCATAVLAVRTPAANSSLTAFKDYLRSRSMCGDPISRAKNMLHRSDSTTKKTSKIQKVFEKRANKIMLKASQTLEQSTGLAIGPRRSMNDSYTEESESADEFEAEMAGFVAACVCRLARHEQRQLLGLVPVARLPALVAQTLKDCFAVLAADVEVIMAVIEQFEAEMAGFVAACVCRLARHEQRQLLGLVPVARLPALVAQTLKDCFAVLAADVEVIMAVIEQFEAEMAGFVAACVCRLARHEQRQLLGLVPVARLPALVAQTLKDCFAVLAADVEVIMAVIEQFEAEMAGFVAACVCRLARHEQRQLLGLVPVARLPALVAQTLKDCFAVLAADVEVIMAVIEQFEAEMAGFVAACVCRLARHEQRQLLGLVPVARLPALVAQTLKDCFAVLAADVEVIMAVIEQFEAEMAGFVAACVGRLARHEQRQLLGLVPVARLPALVAQTLKDCFAVLAADVERACARACRSASKCSGAGACWPLLERLHKLKPDIERALSPAAPTPYTAILNACQQSCLKSLEEWIAGIRYDSAAGAVDGTVHQLAAAALAHLHALLAHLHTIGNALVTDPAYSRAASQLPSAQDRDAALLAIYMRKVLAQLNLELRNKSEQYSDALKAIFLLNNTLYLLQGLQRSGLMEVLMLAEPECEVNYRDMIQEYKNAYLQSWNKLLAHTVLEETLPSKLRDKDRQILKDKFSSFNREWEEITRAQRSYSVPDPELREALKRDNKQTILPPYTAFYDNYAALPFSKNPDKYVKYSPVQIATQLDGYFDEAA